MMHQNDPGALGMAEKAVSLGPCSPNALDTAWAGYSRQVRWRRVL